MRGTRAKEDTEDRRNVIIKERQTRETSNEI